MHLSSDEVTADCLRLLPKAELHLHLEGSITPALLHELSRKYETEYSTWSPEELEKELFRYDDFYDFIQTYRIVCEHLREPADYLQIFEWLHDYFREQNIHYAEVIYSPSIAWKFERDAEAILQSLLERAQQIESEEGIAVRWILDCVRQFGPQPAWETARLAEKYRKHGVVALGLGGDERSLPMTDFEEIFSWARAHELFVHVHAGEIGGPDQIWDALLVLGANRIGHGIQSARDPKLIDYLRDHIVALDICLTSNVKTGAWAPISENPFGLLRERGVPVNLSTDDPGLFGTSLTEEFAKAVTFFGLGAEQVQRIILQGVHASFLPHSEKMNLMKRFQEEIHQLCT